MLSRFCNSLLKAVRFRQIANHTPGYLAPASFLLSQQRNYAKGHVEIITENDKLLAKGKMVMNDCGYAMMIDDFTIAGDLKNALNTLKRANINNPSFKLGFVKVARLVKLMVENNYKFEEIEPILRAHMPSKPEHRIFLFENLMSRLATSGQAQLLQKLFDALIKYNYIEVTIESAGPLVDALLNNEAYAEAVDKFEYFAKNYKFFPKARFLLKKLIQRNEDGLVQRLFELYEERYGKQIAFCKIGFAFIECGNDRKAKAHFEKVSDLSKDISDQCQRYVRIGKVQDARTLLTATKGLNCNRNVIYEAILNIYIKQKNAQEAIHLWREYTNDDIQPTQTFKRNLDALLKDNCMELPLDSDLNTEKKKSDRYATSSDGNITENETLLAKDKMIEEYVIAGDLKNALNTLKDFSINNESFKLDCVIVAKLVKLMVEKTYPFEEIEAILLAHMPNKPERRIYFLFKNVMEGLAKSGQVQLLQKLFDTLIKYNYIEITAESARPLVQAALNNGAYAEAVEKCEYFVETYKFLPMAMVLFKQLIKRNEIELLKRVYKIHEQIYGKQYTLFSLGIALVETGNDQQAKAIFEKVDDLSEYISRVCQDCVKFEKLQKVKTLLTATKGLNCNRDVIYQTILDIYKKQNKAEEALSLWYEYSSDDILPTDRFKNKLATLLNDNCVEIPSDLKKQMDFK